MNSFLMHLIIDYYFWFLLIISLIIGVLIIKNVKDGLFRKKWFNKLSFILLIIIVSFSIYLGFTNLNDTDNAESLSSEYKLGAKSFFLTQKYCTCRHGTIDCVDGCILPRHVHGYPFMLSLLFFFTGVSEKAIYFFNAFLYVMIVILAYFLSYLYFNNKNAAIISSLAVAVLPIYNSWITTGEVVISNIFFIGLSLFFIKLSLDKDSFFTYFLTFFVIIFASNIRAENIVLLLLFIFLILKKHQFDFSILIKKIKKKKFSMIKISIITIAILILIFDILLINHGNSQNGQSIMDVTGKDILIQTLFIFNILAKPALLILTAGIIGLLFMKKSRKAALPMLIFIIIHFLMIITFHQTFPAGIDINSGSGNTQRYWSGNYLLFVVCGVYALVYISDMIAKSIKNKNMSGIAKFSLYSILILSLVYNMSMPEKDYEIKSNNELLKETIEDLKPKELVTNSFDVMNYLMFITDDVFISFKKINPNMITNEKTDIYYIELVSSHFRQDNENYLAFYNETPIKKIGDYHIYNLQDKKT